MQRRSGGKREAACGSGVVRDLRFVKNDVKHENSGGRILATCKGDGEAERADENQIAGEQLQVAFTGAGNIPRERWTERGFPEICTADHPVKHIQDEQCGSNEARSCVIAHGGDELEHHPPVPQSGDESDEKNGTDKPCFGKLPS